MRSIVLSLVFAAITSPLAAQQATLTYLLGKDTSAIEQYSHQGNRIAGTMVQRAGAAVSVVRYDMTYGNDGRVTTARISRLQPDGSPLPNQPTGQTTGVFMSAGPDGLAGPLGSKASEDNIFSTGTAP